MKKSTLLWIIFAAVLLLGAPSVFSVYQGGTGRSSLTAHNVLIGNGSSAVSFAAPSTSGFCFQDNGASSDPTFQACGGTGTAGFATKGGVQTESYTCANDSGSANAYAITLSPTPSVTTYSQACFIAAHSNTTSSTLNVNGSGAVAIKKWSSGSLANLASGDITANQIISVVYDGTQWVMPSSGGGGSTISGLTTNGAVYTASSSTIASTVALTNGQLLIGSTGSTPVAATITAGTNVTVTNGAGSITIASTATGGADKFPMHCAADYSINPGNSFWSLTQLSNLDYYAWQFVKNTNADVWCYIRVPSSTTASPHIILDLASADTTNAHTATFSVCDQITSSMNVNFGTAFTIGGATCPATQNYSSTTTAYANTELSFAPTSTIAADQLLMVRIHQATGGANTSNILMQPPVYKIN